MARKPIEVMGHISKVTRSDGKLLASVTLQIPDSAAADIPMGAVNLTITKAQEELI